MKPLLLTVLLLSLRSALAAMPIEFAQSTEDRVGSRLAYKLKEEIRASSSLDISFDKKKPRLRASIITLDPDDNNTYTSYSFVLSWVNPDKPWPFLLHHMTGTCGTNKLDSCAESLVAKISEVSDGIIELLNSIQDTE